MFMEFIGREFDQKYIYINNISTGDDLFIKFFNYILLNIYWFNYILLNIYIYSNIQLFFFSLFLITIIIHTVII